MPNFQKEVARPAFGILSKCSGIGRLIAVSIVFMSLGRTLEAATPNIQSVLVTAITQTTAEINWSTDVPANSQIILTDDAADMAEPWKRINGDPAYVTFHIVSLSGLQPGTKYTFYVVSSDPTGDSGSTKSTRFPFTTQPAPLAGNVDYRLDTQGPKNVYAGSDLYFVVAGVRLAGEIQDLYINSIGGLPPSTTSHFICKPYSVVMDEANDCRWDGARPYASNGNDLSGESIIVRLRTSRDTPSGSYSATITTQSGQNGPLKSASYAFTVVPAPSPISPGNGVLSAPPIPGLRKWELVMTTLGSRWCVPGETMLFGWEGQVWYYDGGRTYLQIADYTHDSRWLPCADNIITQYRDNLLERGGAIQGWRAFPHGLAMKYWRTGDAQSRQAVQQMDASSPWIPQGGSPSVMLVRETAYAVEVMTKNEQLTGQHDWHLARAVDYLLGDLDSFSGSDPDGYQQSFFNGLAMEALIQYYELTGDPRIPPAVKKLLDWISNNLWNSSLTKMRYNPLDVPANYENVDSNLIAPAFAWYWSLTGDPAYLTRGDEMFVHALDEDISYSGKIFVQNYRSSFDYVGWRSGARFSMTHPLANDPNVAPIVMDQLDVTQFDTASIQLTWRTSRPTTAQIGYGVSDFDQSTNIDLQFSTTHVMQISGLTPNVPYQFRIRGYDSFGKMAEMVQTWALSSENTPVSAPTFSPDGGVQISQRAVTIKSTTPGAVIRYTTDGTEPSSSQGQLYSAPIAVADNVTIHARAFRAGMQDSGVTSATFTMQGGNRSGSILWGGRSTGVASPAPLTTFRVETRLHGIAPRSADEPQLHQYVLIGPSWGIYMGADAATLIFYDGGAYCSANIQGITDVYVRAQYSDHVVNYQVWDTASGQSLKVLNCTTSDVTPSAGRSGTLYVAGTADNTENYTGAMAFLRIYDSLVSPISDRPTDNPLGGEVLRFGFDNAGTLSDDTSGNGYNLSFSGHPSFVATPDTNQPSGSSPASNSVSVAWGGNSVGNATLDGAFSSLWNWRAESRLHGITARSQEEPLYNQSVWRIGPDGSNVGLYLTADAQYLILSHGENYCVARIAGMTDVYWRVQYDGAMISYAVWDAASGQVVTAVDCSMTRGPMNLSGNLTLAGANYNAENYKGAMAFFRLYDSVTADSSARPPDDSTGGEILKYEFEDTANLGADSSGGARNLALLGTPTWVFTPY